MATLGMPQILINFRTAATTAITRSSRGIGAIILNDSNATNEMIHYEIEDTTDIPTSGISDKSVDLIKMALQGKPAKIHTFLIPLATQTTAAATINQTTALKKIAVMKCNYVCHPTGILQDQADLASWVKSQRDNKHKTFKAIVANHDGNHEGVINFTTGSLRVVNPAYTAALIAADNDPSLVPSTIPKYLTYTAAEYTARIMGAAAGLSLDRSLTYYELPEVVDCAIYDDIDTNINNGELCLIDEYDGNGVKIARGCNSLHTFTATHGEDFRYIKIVEALDLIQDDIRDEFRNNYTGKIVNDYNNKMLFVGAVQTYLKELRGDVLDASESVENMVDIDVESNVNYATGRGQDVKSLTNQELRELNTGTHVFLERQIKPVNAMEDLVVNFTL